MNHKFHIRVAAVSGLSILTTAILLSAAGQEPVPRGETSYAPVVTEEDFERVRSTMTEAKPGVLGRHQALLKERYDLSNRFAAGVTMSRGKPVQSGVRVKLPDGTTWAELGAMPPGDIREQALWPAGFYPLPHPNHAEGGMLFPQFHIDEVKE